MTSDIAAPKRSSFAVLADVIVAPKAAFDYIRIHPVWGWAFAVTCVLGMIGGFLQVPAAQHATASVFAHDPRFATMSADQLASTKKIALGFQNFVWIGYPVIIIIGLLFSTIFLLIGKAIGRGSASFGQLWALAVNAGIVQAGIAYLLIGVIVRIRGAEAFNAQLDLLSAIPNLGMVVPGPGAAHSFFTYFGVTQIWSIVLLALGLRTIAGVAPGVAWGTPIVMSLIGASFIAATVH